MKSRYDEWCDKHKSPPYFCGCNWDHFNLKDLILDFEIKEKLTDIILIGEAGGVRRIRLTNGDGE